MYCPKLAMSITIIGMVVFLALCIFGGNVLKSAYGIIMLLSLCLFYTPYWLTLRGIKKIMEEQGVPSPRVPLFVAGSNLKNLFLQQYNSFNNHEMSSIKHNIVGHLLPHYVACSATYGRRFFFWNWMEPTLCLTEAKQIKELLFVHSPARPLHQPGTKHFTGQRLLMNMDLDCRQRRLALEPVFYQSNIQEWVGDMVECTNFSLKLLKEKLDHSGGKMQIEISQYVNVVTAHIMSRTEFSSSYEEGIQIAQLLNQIHQMRARSTWYRFIPISKYNRELKALEIQVEKLLMEMIQQRVDYVGVAQIRSHGNDLLGRLLNEMHKRLDFINMQLIVDECKSCLFAGHDATTLLITWTLMLLACNSYWQDVVRTEIKHICHGNPPTAKHLSKFDRLNMIVKESLRLYPPVPIIERLACEDIRLSDGLVIPKGVSAWIPILAINHCEKIWGKDANEFNPQRFASDDSSVEARRHFLPFSAGSHYCPAQYYALMEAKIILAMFLSKFSFTISQNYTHAPVVLTTLKPKHGIQIHFKSLSDDIL